MIESLPVPPHFSWFPLESKAQLRLFADCLPWILRSLAAANYTFHCPGFLGIVLGGANSFNIAGFIVRGSHPILPTFRCGYCSHSVHRIGQGQREQRRQGF